MVLFSIKDKMLSVYGIFKKLKNNQNSKKIIPGIDVHPITDETLSDATVIDTLVCILLWI